MGRRTRLEDGGRGASRGAREEEAGTGASNDADVAHRENSADSERRDTSGPGPGPGVAPAVKKVFCSIGSGVARDVGARLPFYAADWAEINHEDRRAITRIVAAAVYIFFASALPAIAFGVQMQKHSGNEMGVLHTLMSTGLCGVIQSLFGGQPLLIVGVAEPIVIVYHFMYDYASKEGISFVPWSAWACVWTAIFLFIIAMANACNFIKKFTRFSGETFALLIAILFLQQAITGLVEEFQVDSASSGFLSTVNGIFGLLLAFVYVWASHTLSSARSWRFGLSFIRAILADYGFAIMIVALSAVSFALKTDDPAVPQRMIVPTPRESTWIQSGIYTVSEMGSLTTKHIVAAMIPGFVISVLFYFDHSVSAQLAQQKDFNVKRPTAYHYDLLLLAGMTVLCGLLGLPPVNGVLPQAPLHTKALCSKIKTKKEDEQEMQSMKGSVSETGSQRIVSPSMKSDASDGSPLPLFHVHENRISNLVQSLLCLGLFFVGSHVLDLVPTSIIWAFFAFMSLESVPGNQLWERIQIVVSDPKRRILWLAGNHAAYLETVDFPVIILFTAIQVFCLLAIWAITVWSGLFGISFPIWIMCLVPIRLFLLPRLMREDFLEDLDSLELEELSPGTHRRLNSWFPTPGESTDEGVQDMLNKYLYGKFYMAFRHHLSPRQLQAKFRERFTTSGSNVQRSHSIDIPDVEWNKRTYTDLAHLNALEGDPSAASTPRSTPSKH